MAHMIDMTTGKAAMAFVGAVPWHGLGQELTKGAAIPVWKKESGMDWEIKEAPIQFANAGQMNTFQGRKALFRSDTGMPLSIVSDDYKVVQPSEVLEFFQDLVANAGMYLETAGCLFDGRRFWAMANTGRAAEILGKDTIKGNLLLTSSCDGSSATTAMFTAVRTVCNNTLRLALAGDGERVQVRHSRTFDPQTIKSQLNLIDTAWASFIDKVTDLSKVKVDDVKAQEFFYNLLKNPEKSAEDQSFAVGREVQDLMQRYRNGMGADMSYGTAWGIVNAATEAAQYAGRASGDNKLWNNFYGSNAKFSDEVFNKAQEVFA